MSHLTPPILLGTAQSEMNMSPCLLTEPATLIKNTVTQGVEDHIFGLCAAVTCTPPRFNGVLVTLVIEQQTPRVVLSFQ